MYVGEDEGGGTDKRREGQLLQHDAVRVGRARSRRAGQPPTSA